MTVVGKSGAELERLPADINCHLQTGVQFSSSRLHAASSDSSSFSAGALGPPPGLAQVKA